MKRLKIVVCLILSIYMIFVPIIDSYAIVTINPVVENKSVTTKQAKEIQKKLKDLGYYYGNVDGKFGSSREALNRFFEDQGITNSNNKRLRVLSKSNTWDDIKLDIYKLVMGTTEKGITKMVRNPNDKSLISAIKDCKEYTAAHGFKYCYCNGGEVNMNKSLRQDCTAHGISSSDRKYVTDCSRGVSAALFEYAKANGLDKMKERFRDGENHSVNYRNIARNIEKGKVNKYFIKIDKLKDALPGDILVTEKHVEFFAGKENGKMMVWNWGNNAAIANPGKTESNFEFEYILRLRDISELKNIK